MATVAEILQLRTSLEESIRAYFESIGIAAVTRQVIKFQNKTPRVEIKALIGAATGHQHLCPDGILRYDGFRFQLALQVVTRIKPDNLNAHEAFVGKVREHAAVLAQESWTDTTNFPNTLIAEPLRDAGTTNTMKPGDGFEYSTLGHTGIISVRQTAWPQPTP